MSAAPMSDADKLLLASATLAMSARSIYAFLRALDSTPERQAYVVKQLKDIAREMQNAQQLIALR